MAKAPAPKNMSVFWVIWALSTFGMLYMFNNQNKTVTPPTDTYKAILTANKETKDNSIVSLNSTYGHTLDSQVKEGKLKPEEAEAKKIETAVLVANTQLRAGLNWNDSGRIR